MIEEGAVSRIPKTLAKLQQLDIGQRSWRTVSNVDTGQRPYSIDTFRKPLGLVIGRLQIGIAEAGLANPFRVSGLASTFSATILPIGIPETQRAIIKLKVALVLTSPAYIVGAEPKNSISSW